MAQVNPLTREVLVKLVYYGPGLGGKTSSLHYIHASSPVESRGQLVSLATPVDRTLYFDFLPLRLPRVREHQVRLQLFTVPGQVYFNATRKLVLTGADGVVFVADSQLARHDANLESYENLVDNLRTQGAELGAVPHVLQYNKRDLPGLLEMEALDRDLNPHGAPRFSTCATRGDGVVATLDAIVETVLRALEAKKTFGEMEGRSVAPRFERAEEALDEQIGRASEEIWRSTVQRAIETRARPSSVAPRAVSSIPPATVGDAAPGSVSFAPLFGASAGVARTIERLVASGRDAEAVLRIDEMVREVVYDVATRAELPPDASTIVMCLGVTGDRWLSFRKLVRRAKDGGPVSGRDALCAYALLAHLAAAEI